MIVRLKGKIMDYNPETGKSFNSMIVRLKACGYDASTDGSDSFNSMIVRLKVVLPSTTNVFAPFQFYDSPIKRRSERYISSRRSQFQFYDSPIKRPFMMKTISLFLHSFNSMIVRLKAKKTNMKRKEIKVSIL